MNSHRESRESKAGESVAQAVASCAGRPHNRSADLQSAVSPISNRQSARQGRAPLDWLETQQVENLRYGRLEICATSLRRLRYRLGTLRLRAHRQAILAILACGLLMLQFSTFAQEQPQGGARKHPYPEKVPLNAKAEPLRIAFISYANPQTVVKDSEAVVRYLGQFVGVPIQSSVTLDYGSSIEAMRGGKADLAFVDPLAFMMAHEQIGALPLLLEVYGYGKPTYHSCIWVRRDSGINTLADLKGKNIAFADQIDMSGHLLPREIFVQARMLTGKRVEGEFFKQVYFAGGDEQAMRSVANRFVDAAGVSQYADQLLRLEERDQVKSIATSIESPSHLVMARKGLDKSVADRVKRALLALEISDPNDKIILNKLYGVQGFAEAKLSDFAEVAKIAARYGFVKKPELFGARAP
ncbi:MAG: phosphate/phosphite/phosphonate ABC transporter substrate-binding protein [Verrucomicrobia bacterium]|nr:phosphate/phosphite/phosphonate ABC transporter substrate-binding protein [Verrucomicrobiota bacterium]